MREQMRRRMIEKMASEATQKVEAELSCVVRRHASEIASLNWKIRRARSEWHFGHRKRWSIVRETRAQHATAESRCRSEHRRIVPNSCYEAPAPRAAGPLPADRARCCSASTASRRPDTAASRRRRRSGCRSTRSRQLTLLFQSQWRRPPTPQEFERMVENKVQRGNPLPRGARDGPRQGRRDRQAPHGAEDAVPRRGRGRGARADARPSSELVSTRTAASSRCRRA